MLGAKGKWGANPTKIMGVPQPPTLDTSAEEGYTLSPKWTSRYYYSTNAATHERINERANARTEQAATTTTSSVVGHPETQKLH